MRWYFAVLAIFWLVSLYWWLSYSYYGTFTWLNAVRIPVLDDAALYFFTHLGDGLVLPGLLVLFFWRRDPAFVLTAIFAVMLTGLITQTGKTMIFPDWVRPPKVFADIPGIEIVHPDPPGSRSFPSGHATSMATGGLFFAYAWYEWKRWWPALVGLFTIFLCFTRVIIGVHFPGDIFIGSIVGSVGSFLLLGYLYPVFQRRLDRYHVLRRDRTTKIAYTVAGLAILAQFINLIANT